MNVDYVLEEPDSECISKTKSDGKENIPNTGGEPKVDSNTSLLQFYRTSLTSFSVRRIRNGRPLEKAIWAFAIFFIITFTSYTIYGNAVRYLEYGVKTETIEKENINLPVVTFCLTSTIYKNTPCYNNESLYRNTTCNITTESESEMWYVDAHGEREKKARDLGSDCHVFMENGTKNGTIAGFQQISFVTNKTITNISTNKTVNDSLLIIFQSPREFMHRKEITYVTTFHEALMLEPGYYQVFINERRISRLPHPYSSNCTDANLVSNMFSDRYTYGSCKETCLYEHMLKECKDVIDIWKKYRSFGVEAANDSVLNSRKTCIREVMEKEFAIIPTCSCKNPCEETAYTAEEKKISVQTTGKYWNFTLMKQRVVTEVKLVPDFPPGLFLGTFGGVLGLGGKLQVVFQLIVFILLCIGPRN